MPPFAALIIALGIDSLLRTIGYMAWRNRKQKEKNLEEDLTSC